MNWKAERSELKIAYLVSRYPAVSHTFILQEVQALRALGHQIDTFSVRRAAPADVFGAAAEDEAQRTRAILPVNPIQCAYSVLWALITRPVNTLKALFEAEAVLDMSLIHRAMWLFYYVEAVVLARWLVLGGHQHLHCHFGNNGSNTAYLAALISGLPFSMTLHGIDLDQYEKFRLPRKIAISAFTVCISKLGRARMMQICQGSSWGKLRVVHCGLDLGQRREVAPAPGIGHIVCVARLSEEKGHLVLFEALKQLQREGLTFQCTLVGDGRLRPQLEARVRELGLADVVRFVGALPPDQVAEWYAKCDAVVLASFGEGIPMVLMEAMSFGRPVVATRVGGIAELVEDGVSGYLAHAGSAKDLARGIGKLLRDPDHARALGANAVEAVTTHFRLDTSAQKLDALFTGKSR